MCQSDSKKGVTVVELRRTGQFSRVVLHLRGLPFKGSPTVVVEGADKVVGFLDCYYVFQPVQGKEQELLVVTFWQCRYSRRDWHIAFLKVMTVCGFTVLSWQGER